MNEQTRLIHEVPWNTLIILDACRYQTFEDRHQNFISGELSKVRSPASCTRFWLRETWKDEDYSDITYISTNVFMQEHTRRHKWQYPYPERFKRVIDVWRQGHKPEFVNKQALVTSGRKVLHYNQPHQPYYGKIQTEDYEGYESNLDYVLGYLCEILPKMKGLTVITADHGELFKPMIYHPCSKEDSRLRDVPWFLYENIKNVGDV